MHVAAQDLVLHTKLRTVYICILYNNGFGTQAAFSFYNYLPYKPHDDMILQQTTMGVKMVELSTCIG